MKEVGSDGNRGQTWRKCLTPAIWRDNVCEESSAVEILHTFSIYQYVAFPNRKSFIFDNKLEFSGTKLSES